MEMIGLRYLILAETMNMKTKLELSQLVKLETSENFSTVLQFRGSPWYGQIEDPCNRFKR